MKSMITRTRSITGNGQTGSVEVIFTRRSERWKIPSSYARVLFDYTASDEHELSLKESQIIQLMSAIDSDGFYIARKVHVGSKVILINSIDSEAKISWTHKETKIRISGSSLQIIWCRRGLKPIFECRVKSTLRYRLKPIESWISQIFYRKIFQNVPLLLTESQKIRMIFKLLSRIKRYRAIIQFVGTV